MARATIDAIFDKFFSLFLIPVYFSREVRGLFIDFVMSSFDSFVVFQSFLELWEHFIFILKSLLLLFSQREKSGFCCFRFSTFQLFNSIPSCFDFVSELTVDLFSLLMFVFQFEHSIFGSTHWSSCSIWWAFGYPLFFVFWVPVTVRIRWFGNGFFLWSQIYWAFRTVSLCNLELNLCLLPFLNVGLFLL